VGSDHEFMAEVLQRLTRIETLVGPLVPRVTKLELQMTFWKGALAVLAAVFAGALAWLSAHF